MRQRRETNADFARLERNLWNLNRIANENGGNRAFGLPGYKASVDYVLERAQTRFHEEYDTFVQPFNASFAQVRSISVTGPDGENVEVVPLLYNPGTDPAGISAPLIDTPVDDERGKQDIQLPYKPLFPDFLVNWPWRKKY